MQMGCTLITKVSRHGGEEPQKPAPPPAPAAPHVIIFALDGGGYDQLMHAIRAGSLPAVAGLMGKEVSPGLFEHGYSAPKVESMLPSSTVADWSSIFTGQPPARDGVTGDEWFDCETQTFYAPVPITVLDTGDFTKMVADDLVGKAITVPTLFDLLKTRSNVSLLMVH